MLDCCAKRTHKKSKTRVFSSSLLLLGNYRYENLSCNFVCFLFNLDVNFPIVELDASLDVSIWSRKKFSFHFFIIIQKKLVIKLKRSQMSKTTSILFDSIWKNWNNEKIWEFNFTLMNFFLPTVKLEQTQIQSHHGGEEHSLTCHSFFIFVSTPPKLPAPHQSQRQPSQQFHLTKKVSFFSSFYSFARSSTATPSHPCVRAREKSVSSNRVKSSSRKNNIKLWNFFN